MEQLKAMKECLMAQAQAQMGNLQQVDAKELGEVVDMIKDLDEALYYCAITEAMEESKKEKIPRYYTPMYYSDWQDYEPPRRYYNGGGNSGNSSSNSGNMGGNNSTSYYTEHKFPELMREDREGRSPMRRRMYMESKEMHMGKEKQLQELETYMQELTTDIIEMIKGASPEEKQLLQKKISTLATKIDV